METKPNMTIRTFNSISCAAALLILDAGCATSQPSRDPLPAWNDGPAKLAIVEFVAKITKPGSPDFVPVAERIATFDNDGTLWCEQPMYFQFIFALDRVKVLAPQHPEWKDKEPFALLLKGDLKADDQVIIAEQRTNSSKAAPPRLP